jgi:transposase InsO family protein
MSAALGGIPSRQGKRGSLRATASRTTPESEQARPAATLANAGMYLIGRPRTGLSLVAFLPLLFNERHLAKVLAEYFGYFNNWRPHRSIGQRAPCAPRTRASHRSDQAGKIIAIPVLGGLHHVYQLAA